MNPRAILEAETRRMHEAIAGTFSSNSSGRLHGIEFAWASIGSFGC